MEGLYKNKYRIDSTRLKGWDYSWSAIYCITICTYQRQNLFGEIENNKMGLNLLGKIAQTEWLKSEKIRQEITLDSFVIMPNHIHGIVVIKQTEEERVETHGCVSPNINPIDTKTHGRASLQITPNEKQKLFRQPKSLSSFVAGFKSVTTKLINSYRKTPNCPVWQPSFHDSIITSEKQLEQTRYYIYINPAKWESDRNNLRNI